MSSTLPLSTNDMSSRPRIGPSSAVVNLNSNSNENVSDEDSVLELGQIAILGASRPSLRYLKTSTSDMNASKRSLASRHTASQLGNSRLLAAKFGSKNESILAAAAAESAAAGLDEETAVVDVFASPAVDVLEPEPAVELNALSRCFDNVKGYIYGIISALVFVLSQVIMRRSKWLSGPDHVIIRLGVAFIIFYTYLKYRGLNVLGPRKQFQLLMFRGFLGKRGFYYFLLLIIIAFNLNPLKPPSILYLSYLYFIIST